MAHGVTENRQTLATKTEASMIDLMCLIQPLLSSPLRNIDMEGFCSSHTSHITSTHTAQSVYQWGKRSRSVVTLTHTVLWPTVYIQIKRIYVH